MELDEQQTGLLLRDVHQAFNTEINDILLAGLALALYRWAGMTRVAVLLEGHGREAILEGVNINRTVGWFTTQFPVALPLDGDRDLSLVIKEIKETLRRVPAKGIGYGILRYLSPNELTEGLEFSLQPEIAFNYLGEMDAGITDAGGEINAAPFGLSPLSTGQSQSSSQKPRQPLSVNSAIQQGKLQMAIDYCPGRVTSEQAGQLADLYKTSLAEIIDFCVGRREHEYTPSDFSDSSIDNQGLDSIVDELGDEYDD
jgi:non-ribosomal peptide synthase protein (TIGR01720 family)